MAVCGCMPPLTSDAPIHCVYSTKEDELIMILDERDKNKRKGPFRHHAKEISPHLLNRSEAQIIRKCRNLKNKVSKRVKSTMPFQQHCGTANALCRNELYAKLAHIQTNSIVISRRDQEPISALVRDLELFGVVASAAMTPKVNSRSSVQ